MDNRYLDRLARDLSATRRQVDGLARTQQVARTLINDVALEDALKDQQEVSDTVADHTSDLALRDDSTGLTEFDQSQDASDAAHDAFMQGTQAWDQSLFATDLAQQLEAELGPIPAKIQAALADAAAAIAEAGLARSDAAAAIANAQQAIADAASAITSAQTAASAAAAAQTTADGKNKVVRSTSAATAAASYKAGDQWWQFVGATITGLWLHTGTAWQTQTLTNAIISTLDAGKITTGTLAADRISALSITAEKIAAEAITTEKIAALAVTAAELAAGSVIAVKIAADAVTAEKISAGAVTTAKLDALAVTASKIAAGAIIADKIAAGAITTAKLAATAINGMTITGALIRTAASGQRLELDVNGLRALNASGAITASLRSDSGGLLLSGGLTSYAGGNSPRAALTSGKLTFELPGSPGAGSVELSPGGIYSPTSGTDLNITSGGGGANSGINLSVNKFSKIALNGAVSSDRDLNVLWTGTMFLNELQTIMLTERVSAQLTGIVLVWQAYASGAAQRYDIQHTFVPKWHATALDGAGLQCTIWPGTNGTAPFQKYVYVSDDRIKGNSMNAVVPRNGHVLTTVLGV